MKRILLFLLTNLAVLALLLAVVAVIEAVFHVRLGSGGLGGLLVLAAVFGFGGALISLAMSKWVAKRALGVVVISSPRNDTEQWLLSTVGRLARTAGIGIPEVGLFEAEEMNAFATGARRDRALVAVSSGLLQGMSRPQVEAVLGHEITHIANTFVIFLSRLIGNLVDRAVFRNDRSESGIGFFAATMVAQVVLGIFASMIVAWFSRQREFRADRGGAGLAGAGSMIGALRALQGSHGAPMPPQMQAFGINTGEASGFMRLFMSHPPLEERIAALQEG